MCCIFNGIDTPSSIIQAMEGLFYHICVGCAARHGLCLVGVPAWLGIMSIDNRKKGRSIAQAVCIGHSGFRRQRDLLGVDAIDDSGTRTITRQRTLYE